MTTPYTEQWSRIKDQWQQGRIPSADLIQLGKRHDQWFQNQGIELATALMTRDLTVFADHIEQFGEQAATAEAR